MEPQFIVVKFREKDRMGYTYHNDGPRVAVGDTVKVPDKSGDGWSKAKVVEVDVAKPTKFATKAILGKYEPDEVPEDRPDSPAGFSRIDEALSEGMPHKPQIGGLFD